MPRPCTLTFDLLTLKVVSESRVTWPTSVPILVFLGLCSQLRPDVRDRQTSSDVRRQTSDAHHRLMPPTYRRGHNSSHLSIFVADIYRRQTSATKLMSATCQPVKTRQVGARRMGVAGLLPLIGRPSKMLA